MRTGRFSLWSAVAVLSLLASLACERRAHAQVTEQLNLGSGYNSNFGYTLNDVSYGGGGPIGPSSLGTTPLAFVYCIDIPDEVGVGQSYANNTVTTNGTAVYGNHDAGNTWASDSNLVSVPHANMIAGLLATYAAGATTSLQQDALQSAIWTWIYDNGVYNSSGPFVLTGGTGTGTVGELMLTYLAGAKAGTVSNYVWFSPNGVNKTPIDQALVGQLVPEPSTFAIAALGGAGVHFLRPSSPQGQGRLSPIRQPLTTRG